MEPRKQSLFESLDNIKHPHTYLHMWYNDLYAGVIQSEWIGDQVIISALLVYIHMDKFYKHHKYFMYVCGCMWVVDEHIPSLLTCPILFFTSSSLHFLQHEMLDTDAPHKLIMSYTFYQQLPVITTNTHASIVFCFFAATI